MVLLLVPVMVVLKVFGRIRVMKLEIRLKLSEAVKLVPIG